VKIAALLALAGVTTPGVVAQAGGVGPRPGVPLDPDDVAQVVALSSSPSGTARSYGAGARFLGDIDGDGDDDFVVQHGVDETLHVFLGDPAWADGDGAGGALVLDPAGDSTIVLPQGCRRNDDRVHVAPLGDINGDQLADFGVGCLNHVGELDGEYIEGAVALYLGRVAWPLSVDAPDSFVWGSPPTLNGPDVVGDKLGVDVAAVGDLDDDGFDDFAATAEPWSDEDRVPVFLFRGGPAPVSLTDGSDAAWVLRGAADLRCEAPVQVAHLGDIDGRGRADIAISCPEQPALVDPGNPAHVPNRLDLAYSVFLGEELTALAGVAVTFDDRDFGFVSGRGLGPRASKHAALGDVDGDGLDDFGVPLFLPLTQDIGARFIQGHAPPWTDIQPLTAWAGYVAEGDFTDPAALDFAVASDLTADGRPEVWLRHGQGASSRIDLIPEVDVQAWVDSDVPPAIVTFTPPGGVDVPEAWRFGFAGTGDADGDGLADLVLTSGYADGDCDVDACGGVWVVLCTDGDGDGASPCTGDCDDNDRSIGPFVPEICDAIDHDCNGDTGESDGDADGVLACEGDCDDNDPERYPGAEETCESQVDVDCDGLLPGDDTDGDTVANCLDCQPHLAAMAPGSQEICDGLDNDCDGQLPRDEVDVDRDGTPACEGAEEAADCDDGDPLVGPRRHEDCQNGLDDDCDGSVDEAEDVDGDGVTTCDGDCDDGDPEVFPGAPEFPAGTLSGACDGRDNDCNGLVDDARDVDGDGESPCDGDCDETDPDVFSAATGTCSGADGNCDGLSDLDDQDGDGWSGCAGDCDDTDPGISPSATEYCDRLDNDCDRTVDIEFDQDLDGWASCHGDCADQDVARAPLVREPVCGDGVDGDCDLLPDATDPDCAVAAPPPPVEPRPPGLACAGCSANVSSGSPALGLLLLMGLGLLRRRSARVAVPVLLLTFAAVTPALAAPKAEAGLVVYMADTSDIRYQVEARERVPELDATDILHTSELLQGVDGNVLVVGAKRVRPCGGGPGPALRSVTSRVLDQLISLDYPGAEITIAKTLEDLPCLREPLPRRLLPDLLFYRGVAHHSLGRLDLAEEAFRRLLAVQPDYPGDRNFPPSVGEQLERVRGEVSPESTVPLQAFAPPGTDVQVDGEDVSTARGPALLRPGRHLVQMTRGRTTFSVEVELADGDAPVALMASDRSRALQAPGLHPAARAYAASISQEALLDDGIDLVAWVDLDAESGVLWIFRGSSDQFSFEGDLGLSARGRSRRGPVASGPKSSSSTPTPTPRGGAMVRAKPTRLTPDREDSVRLRIGGGVVVIAPFTYAQIPVDVGIRVWRGVHVDLGVAVAATSTETYGPIWIPEIEVGASYRFELPGVQPRVGAAAVIGVDSSGGAPAPRPGFLVRGGADFTPAGPLLLGFDVQAGISGSAFRFAATAGAGVRF
jgi:hypothetical protein